MASIDNSLVADVARQVVAQIAPDELPLFRATSEAYFRDPRRAARGTSGGDSLLGWGEGLDPAYLTPIVLPVVGLALSFVIDQSRDLNVGGTLTSLRERLAALENAADVRDRLRQLAFVQGRQLHLTDSQATNLASALVNSLH